MTSRYIAGGVARFELDDEDERSRVTEIVGRLLQVPNLSVLLGSGASFHLGGPRIREVDRAGIAELLANAQAGPSEEVAALLDDLVKSTCDLETVLQMLTAAMGYLRAFGVGSVEVGGAARDATVVAETYAALNLGLAHACDIPISDDESELQPHVEFFRRLVGARRTDLPRLSIFTTNYDLIAERALDKAGIHYVDGFRGQVRRRLDLSSYQSDLFSRQAAHDRNALVRVHEVVHLFKIHGSLNWRRSSTASGLRSSGIVQSADSPTADDLAVIYPTPAKDSDVLGYPYSDLLRLFGASLAGSEAALIVSGYGFADDHINRLIEQALAHNPTMQLLVLDPVGVLEEEGQDGAAPLKFRDSVAAALAQAPGHRVAVLTGPAASFDVCHQLLPDVNPSDFTESTDYSEILQRGR